MGNERWRAVVLACLAWLAGCGDGGAGGGGFAEVRGVPEVQVYGAVWSFAADDVYVTAEAGRVLHFDGEEWDEETLDTYQTMVGIWAFGRDDVWMVGDSVLARYDGSDWTLTDLAEEYPGIEGLTSIWGSAPDDVWVGGTQSTAAHWDGTTWQRYIAAGTENTAVWGSGADDVYVVGLFDVAHWDGNAFTELELDLFSVEGVWGFGADDVWMTDGEESLAHFDGDEWEVSELDEFAGPRTLWGIAPDDIWGVGDFGAIFHYDGSRWRQVSMQEIGGPYLRVLHSIHGSADGDVWILGTESGVSGVTPLLWRRGG